MKTTRSNFESVHRECLENVRSKDRPKQLLQQVCLPRVVVALKETLLPIVVGIWSQSKLPLEEKTRPGWNPESMHRIRRTRGDNPPPLSQTRTARLGTTMPLTAHDDGQNWWQSDANRSSSTVWWIVPFFYNMNQQCELPSALCPSHGMTWNKIDRDSKWRTEDSLTDAEIEKSWRTCIWIFVFIRTDLNYDSEDKYPKSISVRNEFVVKSITGKE